MLCTFKCKNAKQKRTIKKTVGLHNQYIFDKERFGSVSNDDYYTPLKGRNKKTTEAKISRIQFYEKAEKMLLIVHLSVWTVAYSSTFS